MNSPTLTARPHLLTGLLGAVLLLVAAGAVWYLASRSSTLSDGQTHRDALEQSAPANAAVAPPQILMPPEPIMTHSGKQALIAKDCTPLRIELVEGKPGAAVDLQTWTEDQQPDANGQYNWRLKITVSAGGLVERVGPADWEAPMKGY